MDQEPKKCKGITKKGKPCEKPPLIGEEYCEKHDPIRSSQREIKRWAIANFVAIITVLITIGLFLLDRYLSDKSTRDTQASINKSEKSLKVDIRRHSLAERILDSQNNPIKLEEVSREVWNLMNNDPYFKKTFYIDSGGLHPLYNELIYDKNFFIKFRNGKSKEAFGKFLQTGDRGFTVNKEDYYVLYMLKDGIAVDSICNKTFELTRSLPKLPLVNISTIDPTGEYLCTSLLDIQVDKIDDTCVFLSNKYQNIPFKISLEYNYITRISSFDELKDVQFDNKSPFYSIDQEISYFEFWLALCSNARVRIRNAVTAESILTTEHFIPVNLEIGKTFKNFNNTLSILKTLKRVQNLWGIIFSRSNITKEEFAYVRCISFSFEKASEVTKYPFRFTLPRDQAKQIIDRSANIEQGPYRIICNENSISLLDKQLQLGQLAIILPPSHLTHRLQNDTVFFEASPIYKQDVIVYKFTDLSGLGKPSNVMHNEIIWQDEDRKSISFVKGIGIEIESWENTKSYEKPFVLTK